MDARGARVIHRPIVGEENVKAVLKQGPVQGSLRIDPRTKKMALVPPHMQVQRHGRMNAALADAPVPQHVVDRMIA